MAVVDCWDHKPSEVVSSPPPYVQLQVGHTQAVHNSKTVASHEQMTSHKSQGRTPL